MQTQQSPTQTETRPGNDDTQASVARVAELIDRARAAQQRYADYDQQGVDEVVTAVAWTLLEPKTNQRLSEQAVADTGLGNVKDKIIKNHRKTLGLLRDLKRAKSVGVIAEYPEKGLIEIARPVGVVAAVAPSTNPVATPYNKTLNALKGRNAIIIAPSPKGQQVCEEVVKLMRGALKQVGAPEDLVQKLPGPVNKIDTHELMRQADLVVVTGSQNNVRAAATSGTPAIGVGAGNVPSMVDETADLAEAAKKIIASKSFDNATSCSSENSLIIVDEVYADMLEALGKEGAVLLDSESREKLRATMWVDGKLSPAVTAKSAGEILARAGLETGVEASIIMVEEDAPDRASKFSDEKLSPVLTVYRARDFEHACKVAEAVLEVNGKGHSVSLHSQDEQRMLQLGLELPVCRVIVNQAHCFATGGSFDNGLPFSLSMGCGTWGGNIISDNMNYRHYLNTTRIATPIAPDQPELEEIFGEYWAKYGISPE
ncbi:MAG: aldehyde dehydrogenase family protein [Gammaproteobacteria bacterium]|nr:aldehyde dehydrogenase family protein [Gammaproteobacteria bacterium]